MAFVARFRIHVSIVIDVAFIEALEDFSWTQSSMELGHLRVNEFYLHSIWSIPYVNLISLSAYGRFGIYSVSFVLMQPY